RSAAHPPLHSFPTRRSSDLRLLEVTGMGLGTALLATPCLHEFKRLAKELQILLVVRGIRAIDLDPLPGGAEARRLERHDVVARRSEEHTSELQSRENLVCRL